MRSMLLYIVVAVSFSLAGCTALYQREFVAQTVQPSTKADRQQILEHYRQFMESNGYAVSSETNAQGTWLYFAIRDAHAKLMPTSRVSDHIKVGINDADELHVEIIRLSSYPPDDFSDAYLSEFVNLTEKCIRESSGKDVKLRLIKK